VHAEGIDPLAHIVGGRGGTKHRVPLHARVAEDHTEAMWSLGLLYEHQTQWLTKSAQHRLSDVHLPIRRPPAGRSR